MDWYSFVKFLHVSSAIIWIGGAFIMVILGSKSARAGDDVEMVGIVRHVAWAAERIYVPSSIATLIFGLILAWLGTLWSDLWVILGLVGVATTVAMGITVLTPLTKKVESGFKTGGVTPVVVATSRQILTIAKFDALLLFVIVSDMVIKPEASNVAVLAAMALVLIVGAVFWLTPAFQKRKFAS